MAFGTGLIPAIVLIKKRLCPETRLQKLQSTLTRTPLKQASFYEFPMKIVYQALLITLFLFGLDIIHEYLKVQFAEHEINLPLSDLSETIWIMKVMYILLLIWIIYKVKIRTIELKKNNFTFTEYGVCSYRYRQTLKVEKEDEKQVSKDTK